MSRRRPRRRRPEATPFNPVEAADFAGLRYVNDDEPGIRRRRRGKGFSYQGPDGAPIEDEATLARIKALAIPPAWTSVWICADADGHIQATGRDARGRKQYRYHQRWHAVRDAAKYERMIAFGRALPQIRRRVEEDLRRPGLPREKVLAAVVRLLEVTLIRVGNREYARDNKSFGLTTMRDRHVEIQGSKVRFRFRGKSGVRHSVTVTDRRLAQIIKRCRDIPGYELFQYLDDDGARQTITSADVNAYLHTIGGEQFTAKDFRTWAGTVLAALALRELNAAQSQTQRKRNVTQAVESVARQLGNTPSVCRKCYIHPEVLNAYLDGSLIDTLQAQAEALTDDEELDPDEAQVLGLIKHRLDAIERERGG